MSLPLRLAPIVGVYGISFVFAMISVAVACVILRYPRKHLWPLAALLRAVALPKVPRNIQPTQRVLVVQPNIDTGRNLDPRLRHKHRAALATHLECSAAPRSWSGRNCPRRSITMTIPASAMKRKPLPESTAIFCSARLPTPSNRQPMNSAVLLGPDGNEIGRYDKVNLVPFGEFVPPLFGFVNRISQETGDFVPGKEIKVMSAPPNKLGVFICYESAFPDFVRQFAKRGATVFFNLSNDGYFGRSAAREQHLLLVRMRAVENRRFIVRSTNDGFTTAIDPADGFSASTAALSASGRAAPVRQHHGNHSYSRHGDWFAWLSLLIGVGLVAADPARFAHQSAERELSSPLQSNAFANRLSDGVRCRTESV